MDVKASKEINDWHLVLFHEENFMTEFANGGKVFIDVGAHVGAWTLKVGKFFDKVYAFEPHPEAFKILQTNVELNEMKNVVCVNSAVSEGCGTLKLTLYEHSSHSTLREHHPMESHCGEKKGEVEVQVISLDDFVIEEASLIKIDVEGAEVEVVKGALKVINKYKPKMIIEIHSPENEQKIRDLLPEVKFTIKSNGTQPYMISE